MAENTNPGTESGATEVAFWPITRSERRSLWLKEYGELAATITRSRTAQR